MSIATAKVTTQNDGRREVPTGTRGNRRLSVVRAVHELTRSESEGEHVCGPDVILTAKSEPRSGRCAYQEFLITMRGASRSGAGHSFSPPYRHSQPSLKSISTADTPAREIMVATTAIGNFIVILLFAVSIPFTPTLHITLWGSMITRAEAQRRGECLIAIHTLRTSA